MALLNPMRPLTTNERAENVGYTHVAVVTADDLTQAGTNTAQTIKLCDLAAGDIISKIRWHLRVQFQNTADTAFNASTASIGDNNAVTTELSAAETNKNGTPITWRYTGTAVLYTAADTLNVTFNSMGGKALKDINRGELILLIALDRVTGIINAIASTQIAKT